MAETIGDPCGSQGGFASCLVCSDPPSGASSYAVARQVNDFRIDLSLLAPLEAD